jgi:hypothetical protein
MPTTISIPCDCDVTPPWGFVMLRALLIYKCCRCSAAVTEAAEQRKPLWLVNSVTIQKLQRSETYIFYES